MQQITDKYTTNEIKYWIITKHKMNIKHERKWYKQWKLSQMKTQTEIWINE